MNEFARIMKLDIRTGSIVRLKSGGPEMTVTSIEPADDGKLSIANCEWFVEEQFGHRREQGRFVVAALDHCLAA